MTTPASAPAPTRPMLVHTESSSSGSSRLESQRQTAISSDSDTHPASSRRACECRSRGRAGSAGKPRVPTVEEENGHDGVPEHPHPQHGVARQHGDRVVHRVEVNHRQARRVVELLPDDTNKELARNAAYSKLDPSSRVHAGKSGLGLRWGWDGGAACGRGVQGAASLLRALDMLLLIDLVCLHPVDHRRAAHVCPRSLVLVRTS